MRARITAGEVTVALRAVRLADRRVAGPVPPELEPLLDETGPIEVHLVVEEDDGRRLESPASATVVRSGRAWTEARGRLREGRGWARRFVRPPAEVVVVAPREPAG